MARRGEHSLEEIKAMVLSEAQTIVNEQGYSALTVRKIAMEMGYTVGSIYMVFTNMADLIWHLKAQTLEEILLALQSSADSGIEGQARVYVKYASQNFNRWVSVFEQEQTARPDWYQQKIDTVFDYLELQLKNRVPEFKNNNARQAAHAIWAGIHGVCACLLSADHTSDSVVVVDETVLLLIRNFLRGWQDGKAN